MPRFISRTITSAALLSVLLAAPAGAGTIYSSPLVDGTSGVISDLVLADECNCVAWSGDFFYLDQPTVLTDIHWWGGYTNTPPGTDPPNDDWGAAFFYYDLDDFFNFAYFYGDYVTDNFSRTDTGLTTAGGNTIYYYSADLPFPLYLEPGTYILSIVGFGVPGSDSTPQWAGWMFGDAEATRLAFELTGYEVPEPATLLLLGTGLGAVAARRRLKKRA